jgi:nucleoside-diphosphate-sugar epimerase
MSHLVITGASGYIGRAVVKQALSQGHSVTVLGRIPVAGAQSFHKWKIGDQPSRQHLQSADAVIHLAHSWSADAAGASQINVTGSVALAQHAAAAGVPRFVFASTTSARPEARNNYGKAKFKTEQLLEAVRGINIRHARIALVYGGAPHGQYAMMRKLSRLPLLPMFGLDRKVQPIHVEEVAAGIITLATKPELAAGAYVLGGAPISFAGWLRLLRKVQTGSRLRFLPLPIGAILAACELPFFPAGLRERMLGLAGAGPMESGADLRALGLTLADPAEKLEDEEGKGLSESAALLAYLGAPGDRLDLQADLRTGLDRAGLAPLGLSGSLLRNPRRIRWYELPASHKDSRLNRALFLASMVMESHGVSRPRRSLLAVSAAVIGDIISLPVRMFLGRRLR